MQVICFEDDRVDRLRPITQARPAYAITCASFRLLDWLRRLPGTLTGAVRPYLEVIQKLDYELDVWGGLSEDPEGLLLVNARVAPSVSLENSLLNLARETRSSVIIDPADDSLLVARVTAADLEPARKTSGPVTIAKLLELARGLTANPLRIDAFRWPHDVVAHHMREMPDAMNWRLKHESFRETADGIFVRGEAQVGDYAVVDSSAGPILLDDGVKVGPFCYLSGPVFIGAGARVIEHAALKDGVSLGHTVKIGGEVEASVIEPYTNKQHHGFLGHSYLGSWINLGADETS